jgi:RNA polymerase sigma-70 factor (ECF subfamily)
VQHREDALEVCQQVWLKAWRKMHTFHGKARFFTWLYRVASFTCMDFARKKAHARQVPLMEGVEPVRTVNDPVAPSMFSRPDKEARRREIRNVFNRALQELSPEHRMALVLREVEGLSYEEIAKVMKCRRGTVMSRIFNARKKMQSYLEDV